MQRRDRREEARAFLLSWAAWLPLLAAVQGWLPIEPWSGLHLVGGLGPATAAVVVSGVTEGRTGLGRLRGQLLAWRGRRLAWAFALLVPPCCWLWPHRCPCGQVGVHETVSTGPRSACRRKFASLPLGVWWLVNLVFFGLGEEVGWRGFLQPRLQGHHSLLVAAGLVSLPWALWHLPLFGISPSYRAIPLMGFVGFAPRHLSSLIDLRLGCSGWGAAARGRGGLPCVVRHRHHLTTGSSRAPHDDGRSHHLARPRAVPQRAASAGSSCRGSSTFVGLAWPLVSASQPHVNSACPASQLVGVVRTDADAQTAPCASPRLKPALDRAHEFLKARLRAFEDGERADRQGGGRVDVLTSRKLAASGVSLSIWSASRPGRGHSRVKAPPHCRSTPELLQIGAHDLLVSWLASCREVRRVPPRAWRRGCGTVSTRRSRARWPRRSGSRPGPLHARRRRRG